MDRQGVTLIEMMISASILGIVILAAVSLFRVTQSAFPSIEAHGALKGAGEKVMARLSRRLTECKRLFQNTSNDATYLSKVQLGSAGPVLSGSALPVIQTNGILAPGTTDFSASAVGNSLFFASIEEPNDLSVTDSTGVISLIRIDTYRFNYYFLASRNESLGGKMRLTLLHGQSGSYADYTQLTSISDTTKRTNALIALHGCGVHTAWDTAQSTATTAFYQIALDGNLSLQTTHQIALGVEDMAEVVSGITMGGYRCGVSPNTGSGFESSVAVPVLATANGHFPGGFEVAVVGPTGNRQIFVRLVLVAAGSFRGLLAETYSEVFTARDLW
jgi:prepilin-type N-terminal cleavage/methylation domain-containing protein